MRMRGFSPSNIATPCDEALPKVRLGICAMDKKAHSRPMLHIISRLLAYGEFEVVNFGDNIILNKPIAEWPACDALLTWHSEGFPLRKAQGYVLLRKPFLVNDVFWQDMLLDRRKVYTTLVANSIPVPHHIIVSRDDSGRDPDTFLEDEEWVEISGVRIYKPFVEKPADGEDHNVHIYYPHSMGGGVKRLFRKVNDKSSHYDSTHPGTVRRNGSFIYEEFLLTGGTDVKVYTVGPRYAHAEARKSPVVDGKVLRSSDGKEMRFPVLLSPQEKEVARMVTLAFGQKVCGFDLLRSEKGKSYVCDVNGWSFVKNSNKYYDDASGILRSIILSAVAPHRLSSRPSPVLDMHRLESALLENGVPMDATEGPVAEEDENVFGVDPLEVERSEARSDKEELRCVIAVIRHGDRTPKQKLKLRVTQGPILELFHRYKDIKGKQAKLKSPLQLQELLDITRTLLAALDAQDLKSAEMSFAGGSSDEESESALELREKLRVVRTVLEQGGHFSGVNRKVQLKPVRWTTFPQPLTAPVLGSEAQPRKGKEGDQAAAHNQLSGCSGGSGSSSDTGHATWTDTATPFAPALYLSQAAASSAATSAAAAAAAAPVLQEALLILKWGGVLTHAGRQQSEDLGRVFRVVMYPGYGAAGGGLLRLHSTYRHDLKIYSSDEGRVQTSAAAFTKGLLDLEGNSVTPILVSLVKKDASMLESFGKGAGEDIRHAKAILYEAITGDSEAEISRSLKPTSRSNITANPTPSRTGGVSTTQAQIEDLSLASRSPSPHQQQQQQQQALAAIASLQQRAAELLKPGQQVPSSDPVFVTAGGSSAGSNQILQAGSAAVAPSEAPRALLMRCVHLMRLLTQQLRTLCISTGTAAGGWDAKDACYSSLSQDPKKEWSLNADKPCGGEQLLLMYDRWQKLLRSFYNDRKDRFDISKVPDIYDSAKYDAIHSQHLGLAQLQELFSVAKALADVVIPCEYGLEPEGKLTIGGKICAELLGKLLCDLASMKQESLDTAASNEPTRDTSLHGMEDEVVDETGAGGGFVDPEGHIDVEDGGYEQDNETMHRLCPDYASDINSPLRHVRTRIYFTSESHMHSLINVLRYSHNLQRPNTPHPSSQNMSTSSPGVPLPPSSPGLNISSQNVTPSPLPFPHLQSQFQQQQQQQQAAPAFVSSPAPIRFHPYGSQSLAAMSGVSGGGSSQGDWSMGSGGGKCPGAQPLLSEDACTLLDSIPELDYLTHVVLRMYESKVVPVHHPERFRVEILFSPGSAYSPFEVVSRNHNHVLPVVPRTQLNAGDALNLEQLESQLQPFARHASSTKGTAPHDYHAYADTKVMEAEAECQAAAGGGGGRVAGCGMPLGHLSAMQVDA